MKKVLIFLFILSSCLVADDAFEKEYGVLMQNIQSSRSGLSKEELNSVRSPFVGVSEVSANSINEDDGSGDSYRLYAIFNNRAKINGRWYKEGEAVDNSYKVGSIKLSGVSLINNAQVIELKLDRSAKNVVISW